MDEEAETEIQTKDLQEQSSKGKVGGSLILKYLLAGGNLCLITVVFLLVILAQSSASMTDYFVSFWVNVEEDRNVMLSNVTTTHKEPQWSTDLCIYVYAGLIISLFFFAFSRSLLFFKLAMWCSGKLHLYMFQSVVSATMRFFDTNPSGRILNRFSKDIGTVDEGLPKAMLDASQVRPYL